MVAESLRWWQTGIIYQIVVPSFLDTTGNGLGDLRGIIERLEYIQWLGVQAIWLSPIHPSPLADMGYDVSDFRQIHPEFGTLDDFDELLEQCHRRQLKVIMDWVPNHTAGNHPWFQESRSSRDNPKRDWYIWRDKRPDGSPPNNWISVFGGSVWTWDEGTEQFYLHTFLDEQPDLNWRNPSVREAMFDTLRFWLDRGVDGFRVDAMDLMLKDELFRDNPPNPDYQRDEGPDAQLLPDYTRDQPGMREIASQLREIVDGYDDRMLAAEMYLPIEKMVKYYGENGRGIHLPLNVKLAWTPWDAQKLRNLIETYLNLVPSDAWPTWMLSTHDCARIAARCGTDQTRVAALLLMTLPGTPTHYYGEEIGMHGTSIPDEQARDPQGRFTGRNRDPERTPMQWNGEATAGFSSAEPWLPVSDDVATANVAAQSDQPNSLLCWYRCLIRLRRDLPVLVSGNLVDLASTERVLAFRRVNAEAELLVVLNFSPEPLTWDADMDPAAPILVSTRPGRAENHVGDRLELDGNEGVVVCLRG